MKNTMFGNSGGGKTSFVPEFIYLVAMICSLCAVNAFGQGKEPQYTSDFRFGDCEFQSTGSNPYFNLRPGHQRFLEGEENGTQVQLFVAVLPSTRLIFVPGIGRVRTRILEERHIEDGELVEFSRNYFAICEETNDVVYFGESVNIYNPDGTITHEGAWQAGRGGALPGIIMPGTFLLGSRYFQEIAPEVALDRAEHIAMGLEVITPAGIFQNCVEIHETSPLDAGALSIKKYCPNVGLVEDGPLKLVTYSGGGGDDDIAK